MGLTFFQTRSNAIILYGTLPPTCIEKVVSMKTKEVFYTKTSKSPRPAPMVTLKANWQKDWNSDAAASGSSSQPIQPNQLARPGQSVLLKSRTALDQQTCSRMSRRTTKNWIKQARGNPKHTTVAPWTSESKDCYIHLWKKLNTCAFVSWQIGSNVIFTKMNCKQIWGRTTSTTHSAKIGRKWSTTWATWNASNYAKKIHKCNALIVYLIGQKILYIVLVEFACVTRMKCVGWIENELMHYRFRTTWLRRDFLTEFDMENLKNKSTITRLATHENNVERRKMHKAKITKEFWTDFWEVRDIANHKKNLDGTKLSVQKWTNWHKNITLTSWRSPSVYDIHQIGVFNSTVQEVMLRWSLDLIIALQSHWKITCTDILKFIKNQSHHKIKTEYVKTPSSQKHTVKKLLRNIPSRSSSRHENWVEILDIYSRWIPL